MFRFARIGGLTLAVVSVAVIDACHKKPAPEPVPVTTPTPGPNQDSIRRAQEEQARLAAEAAARHRADSIAAADAAARAAAAAAGDLKNALEAMVHFDFDQSELRPEDRSILDAKVPILQANPSVALRIAGYTDERGSDEYNLALGQRRAAAVKRYLIDHGIAEARLETVSYGEEHPIAQGSDESAWSQNRRAEFAITAGGQMLRKP
jgi:peptidoglycan-associated lipoprotein